MKKITARQNETWDILAKRELGFEYFAKDIMLYNPEHSDVVIFEGGEQVVIPDFEVDDSKNDMPVSEDDWL